MGRGGTNTLHAMVMAALVVAAALVVGYVVFDLQVSVLPGEPQPEVSFGFSYDASTERLVVTHRGGDALDPGRVVVLNRAFERVASWPAGDPVTAGDAVNVTGVTRNDTVYVMWVTGDGGYVELATWNAGAGDGANATGSTTTATTGTTTATAARTAAVGRVHVPRTARTATFLPRME